MSMRIVTRTLGVAVFALNIAPVCIAQPSDPDPATIDAIFSE